MLSFYAALLGASTLATAPDSSRRPVPNQVIKLGVHGFEPGFATLSYERQLSAQWSVLGSVGYSGHSYQGNYLIYDWSGSYIKEYFTRQQRYYSASAQIRYYFQRRRPRPQAGWFAAGNLQATRHRSRAEYLQNLRNNYDITRTSAQLQLLLGRQWGLGRRLTLDSYLGVNVQRRLSATVGGPQGGVVLEGGLGLQVGYRFRPLPR